MTSTTSTRTEDFTAVLNLPASPATVSALFTSAAGVSRWWGPTEGDGAVGGTLVTSFGELRRQRDARPRSRTRPRGLGAGRARRDHAHRAHQEWLGTTMEFDIVPAGAGTELRFRHAGLTPQLECWDACAAAWTSLHGEHRGLRRDRHRHPVRGLRQHGGRAAGSLPSGSSRRPRHPMRCCGRSPTRTAGRSCASSSTPSCPRARSRRASPSPSRRSASTSACSSRPASSPSAAREPAASTR